MLPFAAALELIHTYSLIHDDLPAMDDDDLRRGRPTCHVRYGEDVAILAGDGLYAEAFRLALHEQARRAGRRARGGGRARGRDGRERDGRRAVHRRARRSPSGAKASLRRLHELKTGRLIGASVECVLLLNGASDPSPTLSDFRAFAAELGVLFQIVDDILDVTGTDADLGQAAGFGRAPRQADVREHATGSTGRARWPRSRTARRARPWPGRPPAPHELEQITDFIATRTS